MRRTGGPQGTHRIDGKQAAPAQKENSVRIAVASVFTLLLATAPVLAQSPDASTPSQSKPSEESIRHLLDVMQAKQLVAAMSQQVDTLYKTMINKALEGKSIPPEKQKILEASRAKMMNMMKEMFSWESMEHLYLKVYADTFTQDEINGMTAFYSSPAGHAVIVKLPLAMKNTMSEMQERMKELIPKMEQLAKETADEVKTQGTPAPKNPAG
jgi:hypothetical protein